MVPVENENPNPPLDFFGHGQVAQHVPFQAQDADQQQNVNQNEGWPQWEQQLLGNNNDALVLALSAQGQNPSLQDLNASNLEAQQNLPQLALDPIDEPANFQIDEWIAHAVHENLGIEVQVRLLPDQENVEEPLIRQDLSGPPLSSQGSKGMEVDILPDLNQVLADF
jgi:hypothetical protein